MEAGEQRYKCVAVGLPTCSGTVLVKNRCGGMVADPYVVNSCTRAFGRAVEPWSEEERTEDEGAAAFSLQV